uniref:Putative secreted protein n=1 Tax=Ixodes ricinus TaxID=34613 RepID=A0A6B0UD22_IXORI
MMEHSCIFLLQIILLSIASNDGAYVLDGPRDATEPIILEPTTGKTAALGTCPGGFRVGSIRSLPALVVSCNASTKAAIPCRSFGARYHNCDGAL